MGKDYNTDKTVKFIVQMAPNKLAEAEKGGLHTFFKLQTTMSITSMVLFDHLGCLRKYDSVGQILTEFFDLRLIYYDKRKERLKLPKTKAQTMTTSSVCQCGI